MADQPTSNIVADIPPVLPADGSGSVSPPPPGQANTPVVLAPTAGISPATDGGVLPPLTTDPTGTVDVPTPVMPSDPPVVDGGTATDGGAPPLSSGLPQVEEMTAPVPPPSFKKKGGKGKVIAGVLALVLLVGGLGAGLFLSGRQQVFQPKAASGSCSSLNDLYCIDGVAHWCNSSGQLEQGTKSCDGNTCYPFDPTASACRNADSYMSDGSRCAGFDGTCRKNGSKNGFALCGCVADNPTPPRTTISPTPAGGCPAGSNCYASECPGSLYDVGVACGTSAGTGICCAATPPCSSPNTCVPDAQCPSGRLRGNFYCAPGIGTDRVCCAPAVTAVPTSPPGGGSGTPVPTAEPTSPPSVSSTPAPTNPPPAATNTTAPGVAQCRQVRVMKGGNTATNVRVWDRLTFEGFGSTQVLGDTIDRIEFKVFRGGNQIRNVICPNGDLADRCVVSATAVGTEGRYKAELDYVVTEPGNYSVKIRVHSERQGWKD